MTRIVLILTSVFFLSSCATLLEVLDAMAQEPQGQTKQAPSTPAKTVKTFAQMDANADGRLSPSEAEGAVKESFAKLDSNKDGFLTQKEVEGTTPKRTDKRPGN